LRLTSENWSCCWRYHRWYIVWYG